MLVILDLVIKLQFLLEKIKSIYGDEMERLKTEKTPQNKSSKKLTESEKLEIRKQVKTQIQKERIKNLIIVSISIIFILGIIYLMSN